MFIGVLAIGFLLFNADCKKAGIKKFTLTVTLGEGVTGTPSSGISSYSEGDVVNYSYSLNTGFMNLAVTIDGESSSASGTITMNANHTLNATAEAASFDSTDIVGTWQGTAGSFSLSLTVDSTGKATGSGVSSTWSIDSTGKVTGGGSFAFVSGGYLIVAAASWNLQLNSTKNQLTGKYTVAYSSVGTLTVSLNKQ